MRHSMHRRREFAAMLLVALTWSCAAQASPPLAIDHGCCSGHGAYLRGEAFEHIEAHERLTPESAKALVHWLIDSGK